MLRVTVDSNIYISSLVFGGVPTRLLDLARDRVFQLSISTDICRELNRVLELKFGWTDDRIDAATQAIREFADHVSPLRRIYFVQQDPTDNRILECAVAGESD